MFVSGCREWRYDTLTTTRWPTPLPSLSTAKIPSSSPAEMWKLIRELPLSGSSASVALTLSTVCPTGVSSARGGLSYCGQTQRHEEHQPTSTRYQRREVVPILTSFFSNRGISLLTSMTLTTTLHSVLKTVIQKVLRVKTDSIHRCAASYGSCAT